ncbi:uncharacterized protein si:ch211-67e16.4 isoform X2 [Periophthalmus magnuspinnatus]|uniref:uncharacterized protein si:ch211-67e16.4 isoform X2 n=1 Tax=Periophthalmus magnuspinnatus TaxID=409849 RepID=UPI00145A9307|nr:uncharacterized protein si:ch211-67e16.4 isoform X2 [Periophthalmus magnuspinnatus]
MDVSIAVSLIRGQMGAVVERAVNGAVETVLAEMLKVVGVKFEELKSQVAVMKRDMETLQREKVLKEKENDNIKAKLRYTELKLKYYRQGVEEELQQHVSLSHLYTPTGQATGQRAASSGFSQSNTSPSCSGQTRAKTTSTPPQTSGRGHCPSDVCGASSNASGIILSLMSTSPECLDNSTALNQDSAVNNSEEQKLDWTITLPNTEEGATPGSQAPFESEQQSTTGSSTSEVSAHADSSTLPCSPPQVKQEPHQDDEVIYIKEEPEEEQDGASMFDCHMLPDLAPESNVTRNGEDWSGPQINVINAARTPSGSTISIMSQLAASMPSSVSASSFSSFTHPWSRRALGLPEEYKKHRKEQQRRSWMKCRELEKTLPQPQLSEVLRERREKTRLRVAKWRAKKKLQEAKARGGAAGTSQILLPGPGGNQNQQLGAACGSVSDLQEHTVHLHNNFFCSNSSYSAVFPKGPGGSSNMAQQTVTSSSSCPPILIPQQSTPLNGLDIID